VKEWKNYSLKISRFKGTFILDGILERIKKQFSNSSIGNG
jgi:hypothetical protein